MSDQETLELQALLIDMEKEGLVESVILKGQERWRLTHRGRLEAKVLNAFLSSPDLPKEGDP